MHRMVHLLCVDRYNFHQLFGTHAQGGLQFVLCVCVQATLLLLMQLPDNYLLALGAHARGLL